MQKLFKFSVRLSVYHPCSKKTLELRDLGCYLSLFLKYSMVKFETISAILIMISSIMTPISILLISIPLFNFWDNLWLVLAPLSGLRPSTPPAKGLSVPLLSPSLARTPSGCLV